MAVTRKGKRESLGERRVSPRLQDKRRAEKPREEERKVLERVKLLDDDNGSSKSNGALLHCDENVQNDHLPSLRRSSRNGVVKANEVQISEVVKRKKVSESPGERRMSPRLHDKQKAEKQEEEKEHKVPEMVKVDEVQIGKAVKRKKVSENPGERRVSPRLQDKQKAEEQKEEKDQKVLERVKLLDDDNGSVGRGNGVSVHGDGNVQNDHLLSPRRSSRNGVVKANEVQIGEKVVNNSKSGEEKTNGAGGLANRALRRVYGNAVKAMEKSVYAKVRETLRLFNKHNIHFVQVNFVYGRAPWLVSEMRGLVCQDVTGGEEDVPIPATNLVDDPPVAPTGFTYRKSLKIARSVKLPTRAVGCNCKGACVDPKTCECAKRNGFDFPYVQRDGGRLIEAKDVIFECGPNCRCGPGCVNRTTQRGIRYQLEVFRTPKKGWAVRSWDVIPSGAPICEYIGVLMRTEDVDNVCDNNYIFDIDCLQTMRGLGGRERRLRNVPVPMSDVVKVDDQKAESVPEFCIDAGSTGNIARFINHSCEPNLFVQCVLSSHHDLRLARVVLFAADDIPPMQELTYDYGYALDSVHGPDGKVKQMPCFCGDSACRRRLY